MLKPDLFDAHVGARLLDFLDFRTPWPRRLWSSGIVLTLKEILETSEMVGQGVLYQPVLKDIASTAIELAGRDPGVGDSAAHKKLHELLKGDLRFGSADYLQLKELTTDIENDYLHRWAAALAASKVTADPNLKPERTARAVCAHLLDAEFSSEFLFGWWRYRLERDPDPKDLHEFVEEANSLANEAPKEYEVLLVFREAPPNKSLVPPTWMSAADVSAYISANHDGARLRQVGGMWIRVSARDPRSGVQRAAEIVDRVASRVQVGTSGNLVPLPQVYVRGFKGSYPLRERRRRVEVHALFRENQLYSFEKQVSRVDSAIELLSPLDASSPSTAVAGGWAAIEELLTSTGDENRVNACHRMAALVACSFPRSELTGLSYEVEKVGGAATAALKAYGTNRDRAACVANWIVSGTPLGLTRQTDLAALVRIAAVLQTPNKCLPDIHAHLSAVFRRLYRNRNTVLHGGRTDAVGLRATLRSSAPLVGAGMDRIAHAWFVEGVTPLQLAARATVRLSTVGSAIGVHIVDLLHR